MGTLYVVSTPIGNLEDISLRAIRILYSSNIILCEDTRQTGMLLDLLRKRFPNIIPQDAVRPQLIRYDDQAERTLAPEIVTKLQNDEIIALVSDAGTPLISDPGYVLVSEAKKHNVPVVSVPGATALLTALTSCGLPADKFMFLGYPPEKQAHRLSVLEKLRDIHNTMNVTYVFYVSPHKLLSMLDDMEQSLGDCEIVLGRELTKMHEELWRGTVRQAKEVFQNPKGELVLLFRL